MILQFGCFCLTKSTISRVSVIVFFPGFSISLVPQWIIRFFGLLKWRVSIFCLAWERVGDRMYFVVESGQSSLGFRYRPLLSHMMMVSASIGFWW